MLGILAAEREPTAQIRYLVKNTLFLFVFNCHNFLFSKYLAETILLLNKIFFF